MDTRLNLALVGFGKFGKIYFQNLKRNKNFFLKTIFRKTKLSNKKFKKISKKNINQSKFNAGIICTPVRSHYEIAKLFLENKIPFILEKPAAHKLNQIKNLISISKKNKTTVLVNHSDLFNPNFNFIFSRIKLIGKIRYIEAHFENIAKNIKIEICYHVLIGYLII